MYYKPKHRKKFFFCVFFYVKQNACVHTLPLQPKENQVVSKNHSQQIKKSGKLPFQESRTEFLEFLDF